MPNESLHARVKAKTLNPNKMSPKMTSRRFCGSIVGSAADEYVPEENKAPPQLKTA